MQGGSGGIAYDLKYQNAKARCISDVKADAVNTSFLAGTLSLKEENEIHLIQISPSGNELTCAGLFSHPQEIWDLASCPFNSRIFSTVFDSGGVHGAAVWEIPENYATSNSSQLEKLVSLDGHPSKIKSVLWWPSGKHDRLISIDQENLFLWSLDSSTKSAKEWRSLHHMLLANYIGRMFIEPLILVQSQESVGLLHNLSGGAWDPHDQNAVAVTCESLIQFWDLRTMKKTNTLDRAHACSVDYNPKRQYFLATAEYESGICVWDTRKPNLPVRTLPGHAHWTWSIAHNPKYDELILSSGTDSVVNLWFISNINGETTSSNRVSEWPSRKNDSLIRAYGDYEDCVYGLAWSSREPWIFASLSYDGRVVVESIKPYLPKR